MDALVEIGMITCNHYIGSSGLDLIRIREQKKATLKVVAAVFAGWKTETLACLCCCSFDAAPCFALGWRAEFVEHRTKRWNLICIGM